MIAARSLAFLAANLHPSNEARTAFVSQGCDLLYTGLERGVLCALPELLAATYVPITTTDTFVSQGSVLQWAGDSSRKGVRWSHGARENSDPLQQPQGAA